LKNNVSPSLFGSTSSNSMFESSSSQADKPQLNASDFFSGAFNNQSKSVLSNNNNSNSNNFTNIEIPDFLKR
jgi:hypothetical protein